MAVGNGVAVAAGKGVADGASVGVGEGSDVTVEVGRDVAEITMAVDWGAAVHAPLSKATIAPIMTMDVERQVFVMAMIVTREFHMHL